MFEPALSLTFYRRVHRFGQGLNLKKSQFFRFLTTTASGQTSKKYAGTGEKAGKWKVPTQPSRKKLVSPPPTNLSEIFNKDIKKRQIYIKSFSTAREGKEFCFFLIMFCSLNGRISFILIKTLKSGLLQFIVLLFFQSQAQKYLHHKESC